MTGTRPFTDGEGPGPTGGPQGGVAVIAPSPYQITGTDIAVPGCAIAVSLTHPQYTERITIHCWCIPPDDREAVKERYFESTGIEPHVYDVAAAPGAGLLAFA